MSRRLLITGANSPLAQAVGIYAKNIGCTTVGTLRQLTHLTPLPMFDSLLEVDFEIPDSINRLEGRFDAVIHIAGLSVGSAEQLLRVNAIGTQHLVQRMIFLNTRKFIYVSGISVYGRPLDGSIDSQTPVRHSSAYGASKWVAECLLSQLQDRISVTCVRSPAIVGNRSETHRNFISSLYTKMKSGVSSLEVSNPHLCFNNVVHDETLAQFLVHLALTDQQTVLAFPVGSLPDLQLHEVVEILAKKTRFKGDVRWIPSPDLPFNILLNEAEQYGFRPLTTRETLKKWLISCM